MKRFNVATLAGVVFFLIPLAVFLFLPKGSGQTGSLPSPSTPALVSPSEWGIQHQPAAAAAATISRAAVPGIRHVARSVTVCLGATAAQTSLIYNLRDGATGAGTILWSVRLAGAASTNQCVPQQMNIIGTANTAMTLESAAAPAATNFATVSLSGYDTQ